MTLIHLSLIQHHHQLFGMLVMSDIPAKLSHYPQLYIVFNDSKCQNANTLNQDLIQVLQTTFYKITFEHIVDDHHYLPQNSFYLM